MTTKTYEVHYTNQEGNGKYFKFETDRDFRAYHLGNGWYGLSNVFIKDMLAAWNTNDKRKNLNPMEAIKYIKCVETREVKRNQGFGVFA